MHASRAAIVAARARIDVRRDDEPESSSNAARAETPNAPRASERRPDRRHRENSHGGGRARAVKALIRSPSIAGDVGRRRPALSPLPNGTVGERTTPLRYARARMAETSGKGTSDGTGAANVEGCDRASDAVASTTATAARAPTSPRDLAGGAMKVAVASRADAQKRELDDVRRELDDVLDALAAAEFERETFENELKHAMKSEREALEFSILHENAARMKERERVVELETVLAERDTQIQTLTAAADAARSRARRGPSRAGAVPRRTFATRSGTSCAPNCAPRSPTNSSPKDPNRHRTLYGIHTHRLPLASHPPRATDATPHPTRESRPRRLEQPRHPRPPAHHTKTLAPPPREPSRPSSRALSPRADVSNPARVLRDRAARVVRVRVDGIVSSVRWVGARLERDVGVMSTPARKRLMRDFKRLQTDPPAGISGTPSESNIMAWHAVIFGLVEDTPARRTWTFN